MSINHYCMEFVNKCVPEHFPTKVPWIAKHYEQYKKARLQHASYTEKYYVIIDTIKGRPPQENGEKIKRSPKEKAPGFLSKLPAIVQGKTVEVVTTEYHSFVEDFKKFYGVCLDDTEKVKRNIYAEALRVLVTTTNFQNHLATYEYFSAKKAFPQNETVQPMVTDEQSEVDSEVETLKQRQVKKKVHQQPEASQRRPRQSQSKASQRL